MKNSMLSSAMLAAASSLASNDYERMFVPASEVANRKVAKSKSILNRRSGNKLAKQSKKSNRK